MFSLAQLPPRVVCKKYSSAESTAEEADTSRKDVRTHTTKITFGDYLSLWKGIATSSYSSAPNMLNNILKNDLKLQQSHFKLSQDELQEEIRLQFEEHNRLMYGSVAAKERDFVRKDNWPENQPENRRPSKVNLLQHIPLSATRKF